MDSKPTCSKKEIAELLPWYVAKSLSEEEMAMVEQHISECTSCKEEIGNIEWISDEFYTLTGKMGEEHINSRLLTIYSESKKELKKEVIQRIDNHLSSCQQCSNELEILNRVNQSLEDIEVEPYIEKLILKIQEFFSKPVLKPAYAYILVLALLYPAWLGLFKKGSMHEKINEPVNISNLFVLEQGNQRAEGEQKNKIILEKSSDLFAFSFVLPVKNQDDNVYQATIANEKNKIVWHDENLKFIDQYGTVIIFCPKVYLNKGEYSLIVTEKQSQSNEVINKYLFNFSLITKD